MTSLFIALALLGAACGSDNDDASSEPSTAQTTTVVDSVIVADTPTTIAAPTTTVATTTTLAPPAVFDERGPYSVGVSTISLGDRDTEVWYPAPADLDCDTEIFDSLSVFPEEFQAFIPEELQGTRDTQTCRDVETADAGPFPVVVYSHGFGGYRQVFTGLTSHLASWGFVVLSTDHIERDIRAQSRASVAPPDDDDDDAEEAPTGPRQDVLDILHSVRTVGDDARFGPIVDLDRVGVIGHSAGAFAASTAATDDLVDAYIPISGALIDEPARKPALVIAGELDLVISPDRSRELFDALADQPDVYWMNITDAGHNSFTDSCPQILANGGLGALVALIGEEQVARGEEGCTDAFADPVAVQTAVKHYITTFLVRVLGVDIANTSMEPRDDLGIEFVEFETTN